MGSHKNNFLQSCIGESMSLPGAVPDSNCKYSNVSSVLKNACCFLFLFLFFSFFFSRLMAMSTRDEKFSKVFLSFSRGLQRRVLGKPLLAHRTACWTGVDNNAEYYTQGQLYEGRYFTYSHYLQSTYLPQYICLLLW